MAKTIRSEIVKAYLKKFPVLPSMTLAKKIYKENQTSFKDVDSVDRKSVV